MGCVQCIQARSHERSADVSQGNDPDGGGDSTLRGHSTATALSCGEKLGQENWDGVAPTNENSEQLKGQSSALSFVNTPYSISTVAEQHRAATQKILNSVNTLQEIEQEDHHMSHHTYGITAVGLRALLDDLSPDASSRPVSDVPLIETKSSVPLESWLLSRLEHHKNFIGQSHSNETGDDQLMPLNEEQGDCGILTSTIFVVHNNNLSIKQLIEYLLSWTEVQAVEENPAFFIPSLCRSNLSSSWWLPTANSSPVVTESGDEYQQQSFGTQQDPFGSLAKDDEDQTERFNFRRRQSSFFSASQIPPDLLMDSDPANRESRTSFIGSITEETDRSGVELCNEASPCANADLLSSPIEVVNRVSVSSVPSVRRSSQALSEGMDTRAFPHVHRRKASITTWNKARLSISGHAPYWNSSKEDGADPSVDSTGRFSTDTIASMTTNMRHALCLVTAPRHFPYVIMADQLIRWQCSNLIESGLPLEFYMPADKINKLLLPQSLDFLMQLEDQLSALRNGDTEVSNDEYLNSNSERKMYSKVLWCWAEHLALDCAQQLMLMKASDLVGSMCSLVIVDLLLSTKRGKAALLLSESVYQARLQVLGEHHPWSLGEAAAYVGFALIRQSQYADAIQFLTTARSDLQVAAQHNLKQKNAVLHLNARCDKELGRAYHAMGNETQALVVLQRAFDEAVEEFGPTHVESLHCLSNIAAVELDVGRAESAVIKWEAAEKGFKDAKGPEHKLTLETIMNRGLALKSLGRQEEAIEALESAMTGFSKASGKYGRDHLHAAMYLLDCHRHSKDWLKSTQLVHALVSETTHCRKSEPVREVDFGENPALRKKTYPKDCKSLRRIAKFGLKAAERLADHTSRNKAISGEEQDARSGLALQCTSECIAFLASAKHNNT